MAEVKSLSISEGTPVTAPTDLAVNIGTLGKHASDAAYVTAKGSAAANGDIYFNTTDKVARLYDGTDWGAVGSGSGSGEINYITNGTGDVNTNDWIEYTDTAGSTPVTGVGGGGSAANLTLTTQTSTILRGTGSFKLAKATGNAQGQGISIPYTIDKADMLKKLKIEFDYNTDDISGTAYAAGDFAVYIYDVSSGALITPDVTQVTGYDKDNSGSSKFRASYDPIDVTSTNYRLIVHVATTTTGVFDLYLDNVIVGPGSIVTGAIVGPTQYLTPLIGDLVNLGTCTLDSTTSFIRVHRDGDRLKGTAFYRLVGTGTGATRVDWDFGSSIESALNITFNTGSESSSGEQFPTTYFSTNSSVGVVAGIASITGTGVAGLFHETSNSGLKGNQMGDTSPDIRDITINFEVPIAEWAGSGTVNLGANDVEYAFNTGTETAAGAINATDFGYGPQGTTFNSFNSTTVSSFSKMRVRFQTPIQPTDKITLETDQANGTWIPVADATSISGNLSQGTSLYGASLTAISSTDYEVRFGNKGRLSSGVTYAANGAAWSGLSTWKWRVVKHRSGIPVGFGLATADNAGLVKAERQYVHGTDFTVTQTSVTNVTIVRGTAIPYQTYDGAWRIRLNINTTHTADTFSVLTISGVTFKTGVKQALTCAGNVNNIASKATCVGGNGSFNINHETASSETVVSGDVELDSKPTWA